jgi:hypothetical protein
VRTRPRSAAELPTPEPTLIGLCCGFKSGPNADRLSGSAFARASESVKARTWLYGPAPPCCE